MFSFNLLYHNSTGYGAYFSPQRLQFSSWSLNMKFVVKEVALKNFHTVVYDFPLLDIIPSLPHIHASLPPKLCNSPNQATRHFHSTLRSREISRKKRIVENLKGRNKLKMIIKLHPIYTVKNSLASSGIISF